MKFRLLVLVGFLVIVAGSSKAQNTSNSLKAGIGKASITPTPDCFPVKDFHGGTDIWASSQAVSARLTAPTKTSSHIITYYNDYEVKDHIYEYHCMYQQSAQL